MASSILSVLGVILTIVGPAVAAILLHKLEDRRQQRTHEEVEKSDESIQKVAQRDPRGLVELSVQLDKLRREAQRKAGHS